MGLKPVQLSKVSPPEDPNLARVCGEQSGKWFIPAGTADGYPDGIYYRYLHRNYQITNSPPRPTAKWAGFYDSEQEAQEEIDRYCALEYRPDSIQYTVYLPDDVTSPGVEVK
jgi:hypothetical protein